MQALPNGLAVYTVSVYRLSTARPLITRKRIAAHDEAHAKALAIGAVRTRIPSSIGLIAEVTNALNTDGSVRA